MKGLTYMFIILWMLASVQGYPLEIDFPVFSFPPLNATAAKLVLFLLIGQGVWMALVDLPHQVRKFLRGRRINKSRKSKFNFPNPLDYIG